MDVRTSKQRPSWCGNSARTAVARLPVLELAVSDSPNGRAIRAELDETKALMPVGRIGRVPRVRGAFDRHAAGAAPLELHADDLRYWSPVMRTWVLEPGAFDVWVGDSSAATEHATFAVVR